jgi:type I restriction enzyme, S subunit
VKKIEECLARINSVVESLSRFPVTLRRFRQAVLAACSGRLLSNDNNAVLASVPRRRIDSLFTVRTGGTPSRKVKAYFEDGSIPWIKTGELKNTDITSVEEYITPRGVENSNAKIFPVGTILIAMYGEGRTRGQIGRLTFPAATNQACAALIGDALSAETKDYVFVYLLSQYETLRAEAVGGNQPNLNLSIIKEWELPFPSVEQQRQIVRRVNTLLSSASAVEQRFMKARARAARLTQSILAKAFRGELVPTEAELARREGRDYEPASVLFERIEKQREAEKMMPKRRARASKARVAMA